MHWTKRHDADQIKARIKASKALNPNRYWLGKTHSEETRRKISESKIRSDKTVRGDSHHEWVGGTAPQYRSVKRYGKTEFAHRTVMEGAVGRKLETREVVHHWDDNKKNNDITNLALLRHKAAHNRLHAFARRHGLKVEAFKFEQPWLFNKGVVNI